MLCVMDKFVQRFRAEQAHADDSESASDFELQPPPRKTAALAWDSSSEERCMGDTTCKQLDESVFTTENA